MMLKILLLTLIGIHICTANKPPDQSSNATSESVSYTIKHAENLMIDY